MVFDSYYRRQGSHCQRPSSQHNRPLVGLRVCEDGRDLIVISTTYQSHIYHGSLSSTPTAASSHYIPRDTASPTICRGIVVVLMLGALSRLERYIPLCPLTPDTEQANNGFTPYK